MKKMMCIHIGKWVWLFSEDQEPSKDPMFGEIVTVIKEEVLNGILAYYLDVYKNWYSAKHFIPLSSIDETEFERNYKKEMV